MHVRKSIQKFDSHVKFFLIVVSFQAASASCFHFKRTAIQCMMDFCMILFLDGLWNVNRTCYPIVIAGGALL